MADRMTPDDADLVAQRVVARLARLIAAIAVTLGGIWVLLLALLYSYRSQSPDGSSSTGIGILMLAAVIVAAVVIAKFWSRMLRGTTR